MNIGAMVRLSKRIGLLLFKMLGVLMLFVVVDVLMLANVFH